MTPQEYARYRENKRHARPGFAYNTYLCTIPLDFPRVALHWHDEMELIYIKKGEGAVSLQLRRLPVYAGCIAVVPPGCLHAIEGKDGGSMEYENILFSRRLLTTAGNDWCDDALAPLFDGRVALPPLLTPGSPLHAEAAACLDEADRACASAQEGYPLLVKAALYRLFFVLRRAAEYGAPPPPPEAERVKAALSLIAARCGEKLTVADAAAAVGYSPSHFMRFFRAAVGQPFAVYLNDYRLTAAARLLRETDGSVLDIAGQTGFDSLSYFCRRFHRKYGLSPGRYRAAARREAPPPEPLKI